LLRFLAIDSSGPSLSAAAARGSEPAAYRFEPLARGHAERILPLLGEVLAEAGWSWRDVGLVAVTVGPGNFTGLRAGIAVARALALALDIPTLGLGTLETVAEAAAPRSARPDLPLLVALDARRDELYAQGFAPDLAPEGPAELLPRADVLARLARRPCRLAGDALTLVAGAGSVAETLEAGPDALALARLAWRRLAAGASPVPGTALRPLYIRPPDARPGAGASLLVAAS
jgi:tRNA threonylcarbamoyladenosine biosynthesis protein TsaB